MRGFSQFFVLAACATSSEVAGVAAGAAAPSYYRSGGLADPSFNRAAGANADVGSIAASGRGGLADPSFKRSAQSVDEDSSPAVMMGASPSRSGAGGLADPSFKRAVGGAVDASPVQNAVSARGGLADPSFKRAAGGAVDASPVQNAVSARGGLADPSFKRSATSSENLETPSFHNPTAGGVGGLSSPSFNRAASASTARPAGSSGRVAHAPNLNAFVGASDKSVSNSSYVGSSNGPSSSASPSGGSRGPAVAGQSAPLKFKESPASPLLSGSPPMSGGGSRGASHAGASAPLTFKYMSSSKVSNHLRGGSSADVDVPEHNRIYEAMTKPSTLKSLYHKVFGTEQSVQRAFQNRLSKPDWSIH